MKVIRLHTPADLRLHDEPEPIPNSSEELIQVKAVGICGSDLHWFSTEGIGDAKLTRPLILGHEFSAVTESGERVAVDPAIPCRTCEFCTNGYPNLCPEVRFAGYGNMDGALCEYIAWDKKCLFHLPDSLSDDEGAMLEPLGVGIHSVDLAHLKTGMTVGVFGCGPIGLLIVQLARLAGAQKIVATDCLPHRVEAAKTMGADFSYLVKGRLDNDTLREATGGRGVDVGFEVAGSQDAVDDAFNAVIPGGKVLLVGIPDDDKTSFQASVARRKGLTIKLVRRLKNTYPRAIDLVSKGLIDVRSLVTHRFRLVDAGEAFLVAQRREGIKVIIEI
jgi:L-iditol 2-dehydrogenase